MSKTQCFKIKRGTDFDKDIKQHFELFNNWGNVLDKVSELLDEKITKLAFDPHRFIIDPFEITDVETRKLFKKDGEVKKNSGKAKELLNKYIQITKEEGLENYTDLRLINFAHGAMRTAGQSLESFKTSENDIYYKCDFDLEKSTGGSVVPITEIEYEEKHLEELKKRDDLS